MEQKIERKKAGWTLVGSDLIWLGKTGETLTLDILRLFPDFVDYEPNQQYAIQYGIKQSVMDDSAGAKPTDAEKLKFYPGRYDEIVRGEIKSKREKADMVKTASVRENMVKMGFTEEQIAQALGK